MTTDQFLSIDYWFASKYEVLLFYDFSYFMDILVDHFFSFLNILLNG